MLVIGRSPPVRGVADQRDVVLGDPLLEHERPGSHGMLRERHGAHLPHRVRGHDAQHAGSQVAEQGCEPLLHDDPGGVVVDDFCVIVRPQRVVRGPGLGRRIHHAVEREPDRLRRERGPVVKDDSALEFEREGLRVRRDLPRLGEARNESPHDRLENERLADVGDDADHRDPVGHLRVQGLVDIKRHPICQRGAPGRRRTGIIRRAPCERHGRARGADLPEQRAPRNGPRTRSGGRETGFNSRATHGRPSDVCPRSVRCIS